MSLVLVTSKAGHDKGQVFVVVSSNEREAAIASGEHRTIAQPKIKKWKHLQVIKKLPQEVSVLAEDPLSDSLVKKILKTYQSYQKDRKEI